MGMKKQKVILDLKFSVWNDKTGEIITEHKFLNPVDCILVNDGEVLIIKDKLLTLTVENNLRELSTEKQ